MVGLGGEGSEVGFLPDGFEFLFVLWRGLSVEEKQVADVTLCTVLIVRLREADYGARQPSAAVFKAALQSGKDAELAVCAGGAVEVALLL